MPDEIPRTPTDASQPDPPTADVPTRRRFLGRVLGAAAVAVPVLSGGATAHFPIHLDVDVQPENAENFVDLDDHDTVAVAVRPTEFRNADGELATFDPLDRDRRYRFGSRFALEDGGGARPTTARPPDRTRSRTGVTTRSCWSSRSGRPDSAGRGDCLALLGAGRAGRTRPRRRRLRQGLRRRAHQPRPPRSPPSAPGVVDRVRVTGRTGRPVARWSDRQP